MLLTSLFGRSAPKECLSYSQEKINNNPNDVASTSSIAVFYECRNTAKGGNTFKIELATAAITMNAAKLTPKILENHHRSISESRESVDKFSLFGGYNDISFHGMNTYSHEVNNHAVDDTYDTETVGLSSAHSQISLRSHLDPSLPSLSPVSAKDYISDNHYANHSHQQYNNNNNNSYRLESDHKRISPKQHAYHHPIHIVDLSIEPPSNQHNNHHDYAVGHEISSKSTHSTGYECLDNSPIKNKQKPQNAASLYRENDCISTKVPHINNMKITSPRAETIESGIGLNTFENPLRSMAANNAMKRKTKNTTTVDTKTAIVGTPASALLEQEPLHIDEEDDDKDTVSSPQMIFTTTLEELKVVSLLKRSTIEINKRNKNNNINHSNDACKIIAPISTPVSVMIVAQDVSPVTSLDNEEEDEEQEGNNNGSSIYSESEYSGSQYSDNEDDYYDDDDEESKANYDNDVVDEEEEEYVLTTARKVLKSSRDLSLSRGANNNNNNSNHSCSQDSFIHSVVSVSTSTTPPPEYEAAPRNTSKEHHQHRTHRSSANNQQYEQSESDEARWIRRQRRQPREHPHRGEEQSAATTSTPTIGRRHRSRQSPSNNDNDRHREHRHHRHRRHHSSRQQDDDEDEERRRRRHRRHRRRMEEEQMRMNNNINRAPVKLQPGQMYGSDVARQNYSARHRQYAARQHQASMDGDSATNMMSMNGMVPYSANHNGGSSSRSGNDGGRAYQSQSHRNSRKDFGNIFDNLIDGFFQSPSSSGKSHRSSGRSIAGHSQKSNRGNNGTSSSSDKYNCEFKTTTDTSSSSPSSSSKKRSSDRGHSSSRNEMITSGSSSKSCTSLPSIKEGEDNEE